MKLNCIIIEDELMARKSLEILCGKINTLNLIASFESTESARDILEKEPIDLIFLDVEMPGMSGIEFLETLSVIPQVIIISSNPEYAYDAFEFNATDFLKKPVTQKRILQAIKKAEKRNIQLAYNTIESAKKEIYIKSEGKYVRLAFESILYFENVGDYVKVVTTNSTHIIYGSLKSIDEKIINPRFLKVHRSYIINLDKIVDIQDNTLVIAQKVIPISRLYRAVLFSSINLL